MKDTTTKLITSKDVAAIQADNKALAEKIMRLQKEKAELQAKQVATPVTQSDPNEALRLKFNAKIDMDTEQAIAAIKAASAKSKAEAPSVKDNSPIDSYHLATHQYYVGRSKTGATYLVSEKYKDIVFRLQTKKVARTIAEANDETFNHIGKNEFINLLQAKPNYGTLVRAYNLVSTSAHETMDVKSRMNVNNAQVIF